MELPVSIISAVIRCTILSKIVVYMYRVISMFLHMHVETSFPVRSRVCWGTVLRFLCRVYGKREPVRVSSTTNFASHLRPIPNLQHEIVSETKFRRFEHIYKVSLSPSCSLVLLYNTPKAARWEMRRHAQGNQ